MSCTTVGSKNAKIYSNVLSNDLLSYSIFGYKKFLNITNYFNVEVDQQLKTNILLYF